MVARGAAHKIAKAGADDHDHEVTRAANAADYSSLESAVEPHLGVVARDGAHQGLKQVGSSDLDAMLSQANVKAHDWASVHAGELVKGLDETTQARVADLVQEALDEGWSNDQLADALSSDSVFDEARADVIARTETAAADVQGNLIGWQESGVVAGKEFVASAGCCDRCQEMNGTVVGLDEEFEEGDPPIHPNCECDVLPVLSEEEAAA